MSDWEDTFGPGTSAESVISGINRAWAAEARADRAEAREQARLALKSESLCDPAAEYVSDDVVSFETYDALRRWDSNNPSASFTRIPDGTKEGYLMKLHRPARFSQSALELFDKLRFTWSPVCWPGGYDE